MLTERELISPYFPAPRKVWLQSSPSADSANCLIFLDAEIYIDRVHAPEAFHHLQPSGTLPPMSAIYLSNGGNAARHTDFPCNDNFASFLASDLLHWVEQSTAVAQKYFLCGLSLSGLSALFTHLRHPARFAGILAQSPSAWWNEEWLASQFVSVPPSDTRLWVSVGTQETQHHITHPPSGMCQNTSQLDSVRRLIASLESPHPNLHLHEFTGGHDAKCWSQELPDAIAWLLQKRSSNQ